MKKLHLTLTGGISVYYNGNPFPVESLHWNEIVFLGKEEKQHSTSGGTVHNCVSNC